MGSAGDGVGVDGVDATAGVEERRVQRRGLPRLVGHRARAEAARSQVRLDGGDAVGVRDIERRFGQRPGESGGLARLVTRLGHTDVLGDGVLENSNGEPVVRACDVRGPHRALLVETNSLARIGRRTDLVRAVRERRDVEPVRLRQVATERLRYMATAMRVVHEARLVATRTPLALTARGGETRAVAGLMTATARPRGDEHAGAESPRRVDVERETFTDQVQRSSLGLEGARDDEMRLPTRPGDGVREERRVARNAGARHGSIRS